MKLENGSEIISVPEFDMVGLVESPDEISTDERALVWIRLGYIGSEGNLIDYAEWDKFVALVKKTDEFIQSKK